MEASLPWDNHKQPLLYCREVGEGSQNNCSAHKQHQQNDCKQEFGPSIASNFDRDDLTFNVDVRH